jgi:hypothetical protein
MSVHAQRQRRCAWMLQQPRLRSKALVQEILERLNLAAGVAKAAQACVDAGDVSKAVEIALDVEQPIYEATKLLNAASLIKRIADD